MAKSRIKELTLPAVSANFLDLAVSLMSSKKSLENLKYPKDNQLQPTSHLAK